MTSYVLTERIEHDVRDTSLQLQLGMNRFSPFLFLLLKAVVGYRMAVHASPINPKTVA